MNGIGTFKIIITPPQESIKGMEEDDIFLSAIEAIQSTPFPSQGANPHLTSKIENLTLISDGQLTEIKYECGRIAKGFFKNNCLEEEGEIWMNNFLLKKGFFSEGLMIKGKKFYPCGRISEDGDFNKEDIMICGIKNRYHDGNLVVFKYVGNCADGYGEVYINDELLEKGFFVKGILT